LNYLDPCIALIRSADAPRECSHALEISAPEAGGGRWRMINDLERLDGIL
jgi:hypothetical protein